MADAFYPFVGEGSHNEQDLPEMVENPARIAVFDDPLSAPRVVVVQPKDVRSYLEEVTETVTRLAKEQGGRISFTVIREVVENLVHAYFREPSISILDGGDTIRFSDQGPGIKEKEKALEYGTTSATEAMKRYIRGVGSGLPYALQYMHDHGGELTIEDNISCGTIVTIRLPKKHEGASGSGAIASGGTSGDTEPTGSATTEAPAGMTSAAAGTNPGGQNGAAGSSGGLISSGGTIAAAGNGATGMGMPQPAATQMMPQTPMPAYGYPQQGAQQMVPGYGYPTPMGYAPMPGYPQMQPQQIPMGYQPPMGYAPMPGYPHQAMPAATGLQPQPGMMAGPMGSEGSPGVAAGAEQAGEAAGTAWQHDITVTERGREALAYLTRHESVGPTELTQLYGSSMSTWTRELKRLEDQGLVRRVGQKRFLTEVGRAFAQSTVGA